MNTCLACDRELFGDAAGHQLCPGCARATGERLDRLPALYRALAAFLAPTGRRPETGSSRPAEAPLPVHEHVLDLRGPGGIVGVLEDWRAALHADLEWSPPAVRGTIEARVTRAVRGLRDNLPWIAETWPEAGTFATELRNLHAAVLSIVNPPEHTLRVGTCPAVFVDGAHCGAVLRTTPGADTITCNWCDATWPPDTWLTLAATQTEGEAA